MALEPFDSYGGLVVSSMPPTAEAIDWSRAQALAQRLPLLGTADQIDLWRLVGEQVSMARVGFGAGGVLGPETLEPAWRQRLLDGLQWIEDKLSDEALASIVAGNHAGPSQQELMGYYREAWHVAAIAVTAQALLADRAQLLQAQSAWHGVTNHWDQVEQQLHALEVYVKSGLVPNYPPHQTIDTMLKAAVLDLPAEIHRLAGTSGIPSPRDWWNNLGTGEKVAVVGVVLAALKIIFGR